jgi:CHAT domain-containing protein
MERLARAASPRISLVAAGTAVHEAARHLDGMLMAPIRRVVGDRSLVIVPTGSLHDLPWAALPSCARRPVTVAPSAQQWLTACRRPARSGRSAHKAGRTLLVAGPGLEHAPKEVADLSALHPDAVTLTGPRASVDGVLAVLTEADLAHVVAHGTFRSDNPMFSALSLWDGPLTVYDLERSGGTPTTVVLASCHVGASVVARGDELVGFASSLLPLGTRTVVASVAPVPDTTSRELMVELHRHLRAGEPPATALAQARVRVQQDASASDPDAAALVALAAFGCMGAG